MNAHAQPSLRWLIACAVALASSGCNRSRAPVAKRTQAVTAAQACQQWTAYDNAPAPSWTPATGSMAAYKCIVAQSRQVANGTAYVLFGPDWANKGYPHDKDLGVLKPAGDYSHPRDGQIWTTKLVGGGAQVVDCGAVVAACAEHLCFDANQLTALGEPQALSRDIFSDKELDGPFHDDDQLDKRKYFDLPLAFNDSNNTMWHYDESAVLRLRLTNNIDSDDPSASPQWAYVVQRREQTLYGDNNNNPLPDTLIHCKIRKTVTDVVNGRPSFDARVYAWRDGPKQTVPNFDEPPPQDQAVPLYLTSRGSGTAWDVLKRLPMHGLVRDYFAKQRWTTTVGDDTWNHIGSGLTILSCGVFVGTAILALLDPPAAAGVVFVASNLAMIAGCVPGLVAAFTDLGMAFSKGVATQISQSPPVPVAQAIALPVTQSSNGGICSIQDQQAHGISDSQLAGVLAGRTVNKGDYVDIDWAGRPGKRSSIIMPRLRSHVTASIVTTPYGRDTLGLQYVYNGGVPGIPPQPFWIGVDSQGRGMSADLLNQTNASTLTNNPKMCDAVGNDLLPLFGSAIYEQNEEPCMVPAVPLRYLANNLDIRTPAQLASFLDSQDPNTMGLSFRGSKKEAWVPAQSAQTLNGLWSQMDDAHKDAYNVNYLPPLDPRYYNAIDTYNHGFVKGLCVSTNSGAKQNQFRPLAISFHYNGCERNVAPVVPQALISRDQCFRNIMIELNKIDPVGGRQVTGKQAILQISVATVGGTSGQGYIDILDSSGFPRDRLWFGLGNRDDDGESDRPHLLYASQIINVKSNEDLDFKYYVRVALDGPDGGYLYEKTGEVNDPFGDTEPPDEELRGNQPSRQCPPSRERFDGMSDAEAAMVMKTVPWCPSGYSLDPVECPAVQMSYDDGPDGDPNGPDDKKQFSSGAIDLNQ